MEIGKVSHCIMMNTVKILRNGMVTVTCVKVVLWEQKT